MSIVLDASAAVAGLFDDGPARDLMSRERLRAPHLVDHEVASTLRRHVLSGGIDVSSAQRALDVWRRTNVKRYAALPQLERVWELRENLTAYDAGYVALAEALGCPLVTADRRLGRAPGPRCPITVVPA